MKYGLRIPSFALGPKTAGLQEMGRYLRRAEDLGFDSAVSIDHLLLMPPAYACTWLEPIAMLSALAGVTRTIKLGTMVLFSVYSGMDLDYWKTYYLLGEAAEVADRISARIQALDGGVDTIVLNPLNWGLEQLELIAGEVLPRVKGGR
jgi:alkanesulfonate monooxygenase SsuD/methylene tetrahydromethanopterin reductase-like flavin-dependent oxidoreductase (luciferase family)